MTIDTFAAQLTGSVDQVLPLEESICSNEFANNSSDKKISFASHLKKMEILNQRISRLKRENKKLTKKLEKSAELLSLKKRPVKIPR